MKLALFFDWLFYQGDKDSIMNIGKSIVFEVTLIHFLPSHSAGNMIMSVCQSQQSLK